jgi:light-harvesting protein B-800-850 alpha chain
MNQGRIWCVVNPTVGLPLFLGSVALTSLAVHYSIMTNTTWMKGFFEGGKMKKASIEDSMSPVAALSSKALPGFVISVAPVSAESARLGSSFVVTVAPTPAQVQAMVDDPSTRPPDTVSLATLAIPDTR